MFLSSFSSNWALVFLVLSQHVWAVLLYFFFVVCPCFHFLCALHFSWLRTSLLSQVGLLPKVPVFLNNGLNKWCMLISKKLALGNEFSKTGGGGGVRGNVLPICFPRKEINSNFLPVWMIIQYYFQGWGVIQAAAYNWCDFLNEDSLYMVVWWFG